MLPQKITPYYESLIDLDDPRDPLARMVRFSPEEAIVQGEEMDDPIGDGSHGCAANGRLVHRYPDRALLLVTDRCAAHCRFCFRRSILGDRAEDITDREVDEAVRYVAAHKEIREIVLTGGDPLSLSDSRLGEVLDRLKTHAGVCSVRIHTRFPVYDPARCDKGISKLVSLVDTLVVHVNHSREITPAFKDAAAVLKGATFLLNQSVLLKGVNDSREELAALSRGLASAGVLPYYLHYPDLARGTSHFRIPLKEAIALVSSLQGHLPGYLIPRFVLDIPGGGGKISLHGDSLQSCYDGTFRLVSPLSGAVTVYGKVDGV